MSLYYCYPQGKPKALTLSYDDGRTQDKRLVAILNQYGIKGTFNLNFGFMEAEDRIHPGQAAQLYQGHEIATHAFHHPVLTKCPPAQAAQEILKDRLGLEGVAGCPVRGHAYPFGAYDQKLKDLLKGLGIAYARTVSDKPDFELPEDPLEWHPTCHHLNPRLMEYAKQFVEDRNWEYLKLMYVWGHSYEFDDQGNWDVIEEFCSFMGGRKNIWYATNIEIIDYLQVLDSLRFTADAQGVYNPSAASAWMIVDDKRVVEAKGGCLTSLA